MTKEEIVDQICNDLSGAGWNLFQGEAEKKQVAEHLARLRYRRDDTIVLRCNEDGKWETYEPYATIECPTEEDYDFLVRAVEHYKRSKESGWISVDEDFPKVAGREYFVWDDVQKTVKKRFFYRIPPSIPLETYPYIREYFGNSADYKKYTHWRPLPEPPDTKGGV